MSEYIVETFGSTNGGTYDERREEIVRCRDCKHVYIEDGAIHRHWCDRKERGKQHSFVCHPDGFCAWGERLDA